MSINVSTKFKELILGTSSFADIFDGGRILLYSGARPSSADAGISAAHVAAITNMGITWSAGGSGGLQFEQSGAWMSKNAGQTWKMVGLANSTVTWFRLYGNSALDTGEASLQYPRLDGDISDNPAADFVFASSTVSIGQILTVQQFLYSLSPL